MIRVTVSWGPLNRTAEIHESTGRRLNDFAGKWRQEGETWWHFVERVMAVFESAAGKPGPGAGTEPGPDDPFRGVKRVDGGRVSVRLLLLTVANVAGVVFTLQGRWAWVGLCMALSTVLAWPSIRELWRLYQTVRIIREAFRKGGPPGSALDKPEDFPAVAPPDPDDDRALQEIFPDLCDVCGHAPHYGMACAECETSGGSHA